MLARWFHEADSTETFWYRRLPIIASVVSMALVAALTLGTIYFLHTQAQTAVRMQVEEALQRVRERLDRELLSLLAVPETVAAFIAAEGGIDESVFAAVVSRLAENNTHIRNVALAPNSVITTVFPRQGNEAAIGLRYLEHPVQRDAVLRAINSRRTVVAGPIALVQGGSGIVSRTPVFLGKNDGSPYWGIVSMAVDAGAVFARTGFENESDNIDVAARGANPNLAQGAVFAGKSVVFDRRPIELQYTLPGGDAWTLAATPAGGWAQISNQMAGIAAIATLLGLAIGMLAYRLAASHQKIRALSVRDTLTGLPNRRLIEDRMTQALTSARRYGRVGVLIVLDIDRFQAVNHHYGRHAGDEVLIRVASRVADIVRNIGSAARTGGDNFAVVLPEISVPADAITLVHRIQLAIAEPISLTGKTSVRVSASAGVVTFGTEAQNVAALFASADKAMREQKATRRDTPPAKA